MNDWTALAATLLRENRLKAGLSQRALGERARVPQPDIARIEGGHVQPSLPVLGRLLDSLGVEFAFSTTLHDNRLSPAAIATSVAAELPNEQRAFRVCLVLADDLTAVTPARLEELVVERPVLTGDHRYDALIASITEQECVRAHLAAPSWVSEPARTTEEWIVSGIEGLAELARATSPPAFARHGVFVLENELIGA